MTTITIEQLAEKLNGNLWIKGDMKRIYLDEGHNTKKMSTKTYVFQNAKGDYIVSCNIDCPSQHDNWISSQEDEIIASVERRIEQILRIASLELVDSKIISKREIGVMVYVSENGKEPTWYTEERFSDEFDTDIEDVFEIPGFDQILKNREAKMEKMRKEAEEKREAERIELGNKKKAENIERAKEELSNIVEAQRVNHSKFGKGTVISSSDSKIEVLFDDTEIGLKSFLPKFVKFEIINE